ncbi:MAG: bifunctional tetrahydrofolate synthase/dihydrofolate synthase [Gammaproteobacteria bacterium]|jgi:dihydrofolate synthase/folylpolyglutamate synthase
MRFTTLEQWLRWQESLHPREIDLGLDRVREVFQRLQLGEPPFKIISVAGTNGKGSCVAMLDAIYRAAGYNVGAYTSPHIKRYNERVVVNGQPVSDNALCDMFERVDQSRQDVSLTYFEFGTLAAIGLFYQAQVDVVILEVGLGGRLDAVNIMDADVALISSIGLDHEAWLGNSREAVALEKAGIARAHHPVVCGDPDPPARLMDHLASLQAPLFLINRDFHFQPHTGRWDWQSGNHRRSGLPMPALPGDIQILNAASVLMTVDLLAEQLPVSDAGIHSGLQSVTLPGRLQLIPGEVTLFVDVAHNPQSAQALALALTRQPCQGKTRAVFAVLKDKDVTGILRTMAGVVDAWYIAQLDVERAMAVGDILEQLRRLDATVPAACYDSVELAKNAATEACVPGDRVVVFGSFYVVSEVL